MIRAPPPLCEPVWSLSKGSPLFQHMAVAVCVQALPIGVTVGQASKVLCLDPCRYGQQLCTFTAGHVTETADNSLVQECLGQRQHESMTHLLCLPTLMSSASPLRPMAVVLWCKLRRDLAGKAQQGSTRRLLPNKTVCLHEVLLPSRMPVPSECCKAHIVLAVLQYGGH